jgi:predicted cupin superfamily sugar epimerase/mannose-6-phosphate isomerase-like protein (cupin superfamily)
MLSAAALADPPLPPGMAGRLIEHYHMHPVPQEGCWFSVTYTGDDVIDGAALPGRYAGRPHGAGSAIVALETARDFSAMHRLKTDEVWHFYGGAPLEMLLLYPDGHGRILVLGSDVLAGQLRQFTVPHGVWQGSAPARATRSASTTPYSFVGTQLSPAFDYADFEIGYRDDLQRRYPAFATHIERLTRADFANAPAPSASPPPSPSPAPTVVPAPPASPTPPVASAPAASSAAAASPAPRPAFTSADVPEVTVSPGVTLQELVGRDASAAKTSALSIAKFTLGPGRTTGQSFNHRSQEVFLVTAGRGRVTQADGASQVGPGSVAFIPAAMVHSIQADADGSLTFYAISAPAYEPDDYVRVEP